MIKLCIFDLDGTVLDTIETIAYYANSALEKNGVEPIPVFEYKKLAGMGIVNLIKNMLNYRGLFSDELFEKVYDDYDNSYNHDVSYKTKIFDGLKEKLDVLKSEGKKLAVISNKPDYAVNEVVKQTYGAEYFQYVSGQKAGYPLKPNPSLVLDLIQNMNVEKYECVFVGDTSVDMKTGKAAGVYTIGVLWGFRDKQELVNNGADDVVETPFELYTAITSL